MGYNRGDSFPFDFEPNGISFGSEIRKENCHQDHIPCNVKGNGNIVFSVNPVYKPLIIPKEIEGRQWRRLLLLIILKENAMKQNPQ